MVQVNSYTFNTNGQLVKQSLYNEAGECIIRIENTYNGKKCIKSTTYYSYSNETSIQNLIEVKDNTQIWEIKQGDEITLSECVNSDNYSCITKKKDGAVTEKQEHWFNDNGNVIEVKITNGKEIVYWSKSKFQDGNEVQTEFLKGDLGGIATYLYSNYDDKGNWTKKIVYRNGEPEGIVIREIEYKQ